MPAGIGSFLRNLFGPGTAGPGAGGAPASAVEYKGYSIRPAPRREGAVWVTAGVIVKQFPDGVREHHFIRADTASGREEVVAISIRKAQQIIDEQGDRMFEAGAR